MPTHAAPAPLPKPDGNIKVAVERVIHDALRDQIQRIKDEHGIRVISLHVQWSELGPLVEKPCSSVRLLRVETMSGDR